MDDLSSFMYFTEKADKLVNSTFSKEMTGKTGIYLSWEENKQIVVNIGPNGEFIDAFVLTFRFFKSLLKSNFLMCKVNLTITWILIRYLILVA
jgi:hypothetical protein